MLRFMMLAMILLFGTSLRLQAAGTVSIIPRPVQCQVQDGTFEITPSTRIIAAGDATAVARSLQDALAPAMGCRLAIVEGHSAHRGAILLKLDPKANPHGEEGYRLAITKTGVTIEAFRPAGLFWGIQTLRQILPPEILRHAKTDGVKWTAPCVEVIDKPRFGWRGLMIDSGRYFVPRSEVLRFLDVMALYKMNSLHFHLTDDQGWRIEIRKYPKLTEVGAWRDETIINQKDRKAPPQFDGRRHGGFYTQDDIREIVRYAAERHINVVPEIEMPGHARAAIAAYPQLGCNPETQLKPWTRWGVCPDIFNPSDETVRFLQDVLTEVLELFPSKFIHVGGDEARKDQWKASPEIQQRIKDLGLKNEEEMQSWFVHQMDAFLARHGRRLIGWDEILEGGLAPGATVMSWRGEKGGIAAAKAGHDVVMAPTDHTYLDYYQGPPETEPLAIGGFVPLEKVYSYEPIPKELSEEESHHVLGAQCQLWEEFIPTPRHLEYMAFPRTLALAEVVWSPKNGKEWSDFRGRLPEAMERLHVLDMNARPLDPPKPTTTAASQP